MTEEVRSHQRTLLSESFGIALAADLIERYVIPNPSGVVDADAVDYDPVLRVDMAALPSHKPDCFWYREDGGRLSEVVVVEVKGTTSGRTRCVKQMARGVEQVLVPALGEVDLHRAEGEADVSLVRGETARRTRRSNQPHVEALIRLTRAISEEPRPLPCASVSQPRSRQA